MNVLSIQSHVVHGYVGNRAATFPLQLRGWNVDALNSVMFSNHTGYGSFAGTRTSADDLKAIYDGLCKVDFKYNALLTGYVPSPEAAKQVGEIGIDLKNRFPDLVWLMDPVMGDEGKLYVSPEVVPIYQNTLKSGAVTLITPNGFEVETLTGIKLTSHDAVLQALQVLHRDLKVPNVVISSVVLDDKLLAIGSSGEKPFVVELKRIPSYFSGTGDLFAALLLDRFYYFKDKPDGLAHATAAALASVKYVLEATYNYTSTNGIVGRRGDANTMQHMELRLIDCRRELMDGSAELPYEYF